MRAVDFNRWVARCLVSAMSKVATAVSLAGALAGCATTTPPHPPGVAPSGSSRTAAALGVGWPIWIGIVCEDLESQRRFYRDVLGLTEREVGVGWIHFDLDGKLLELFAKSDRPEYARPGVTVGFAVDDIRAARATLMERGAIPVGPIEGDANDSWAYFKDGEGNLFEITQKRSHRATSTSTSAGSGASAVP